MSYTPSWLGPRLYPIKISFRPPFPPTDPLIADYDFNFYSEFSPTIANQSAVDLSDALINEPALNTYVYDPSGNSYLSIFAPYSEGDQTGGILCPSLGNVRSIEMWVNYQVGESYGQYFFDFRTGLSDGFWITADGGFGDNIGLGVQGGEVFANTDSLGIITDTQPAMAPFLAGKGWYQIVVNFLSSFTDDLAFFMRYTGEQGMPISVAQVCIYDRVLTPAEILILYNNKCNRYGLSPK